ncbi:hypothetical protein [Nitrogeniibacter aestuarii]|uniref:hypothetical protein n=1 Tax=Nitrogeniibacter aestuarii TaxID=2815343 RepID=UPI001D12DD72|nr:hypothetical protein [Nitrogeniibacter aestuarii]
MSEAAPSCLHLLERAYSYLQRAGLSELECCHQVQWLAGAMADALAHGPMSEAAQEALWQALMSEAKIPFESVQRVQLAPPPQRGSIGYARFGRG